MKFLHAAAFCGDLNSRGCSNSFRSRAQQDKDKPKQQEEEKKKQPAPKEKPQTKPDERPKSNRNPIKKKQGKNRQTEAPAERTGENDEATAEAIHSEPSQSATSQHGSRTTFAAFPPEHFRANFGRQHHFACSEAVTADFSIVAYSFELVGSVAGRVVL